MQLLVKDKAGTLSTTAVSPTGNQPPISSGIVGNGQSLTCLINEKDLCLYGRLGDGSFGVVRKGDWTTQAGNKVCATILLGHSIFYLFINHSHTKLVHKLVHQAFCNNSRFISSQLR